jgi:FMN phosphatase YigB (HAD superfamily)
MFEHALEHMGLPAQETVLIDDAKENLEAAKAFGIQAVWLNTKSEQKDESLLTINSLSEILEYL